METRDDHEGPEGSDMLPEDHPLLGESEKGELEEHYYRVLHIADPKYARKMGPLFEADSAEFPALAEKHKGGCAILIYDVGTHEVLCRALEFFDFKGITAFTWKG